MQHKIRQFRIRRKAFIEECVQPPTGENKSITSWVDEEQFAALVVAIAMQFPSSGDLMTAIRTRI